jgi:hypothetical protein
MPTRTHRSRIARLAALAGLAGAALSLPSGALANGTGAGCDIPATSQEFAQFGDSAYYYLPGGANFESATAGDAWRRSGSTIVSGSEPYALWSTRDKNALRMPAGSSVQSGRFCVSADFPHARFMARSLGSAPLEARVDLYDTTSGAPLRSSTTQILPGDHANWAPTAYVSLDTTGMAAGERAMAQVTISSQGDWLVDNVFIDPYMR